MKSGSCEYMFHFTRFIVPQAGLSIFRTTDFTHASINKQAVCQRFSHEHVLGHSKNMMVEQSTVFNK